MVNEDNKIGKLIFDRYLIQKKLGDGASSTVYQAEDTQMHRLVALKLLEKDQSELALNTRAFETEVEAITRLSRLHNDHIVEIYDISLVGNGDRYIVMEHVPGLTLRQYLNGKQFLPINEVLNCAEQVLMALRAAHKEGIVHRDIKPQNVLLATNGQLKVTDFGIAKLQGVDRFKLKDRAIGTVQYISPEQASGRETDARSDLYSLGIMLYELTTGRLPFDGAQSDIIAQKQITDTPVPPREYRRDIPAGLEQIILCAMEKDPADRFRNADAMLSAVNRVRKDPGYIFPASPAELDPPAPKTGISAVTGITQLLQKPIQAVNNALSKKTRRQRNMLIGAVAAVSTLLVAAIVVLIIVGANAKHQSVAPAELPPYATAGYVLSNTELMADKLWNDNYTLMGVHYVYSIDVAKDEIIECKLGEVKEDGSREVYLTVSEGPQLKPGFRLNLSGNFQDVKSKMRTHMLQYYGTGAADMIDWEVTYVKDNTVPVGDIIWWQNKETGDTTVYNPDGKRCTLEVLVSASDAMLVCDLIGTQIDAAIAALKSYNITPKTNDVTNSMQPFGEVFMITLEDGVTMITPDMEGNFSIVVLHWYSN